MVLDTNILIAYLDGDEVVMNRVNEWRRSGEFLFVPSLVEAELLSFQGLTDDEIKAIINFIGAGFIYVPCDRIIAITAGNLRRKYKIKLADAIIAATALSLNTTLVTRNVKDFKFLTTRVLSI